MYLADRLRDIFLGWIAVPLAFLVVTFLLWLSASQVYTEHTCTLAVQATVVELVEMREHNTQDGWDNIYTTYYPLLQYSVDGTNYTYHTFLSVEDQSYSVGDIVPILCNPNDPSKCIIDTHSKTPAIIIPIFIIILLGLAYLMLKRIRSVPWPFSRL